MSKHERRGEKNHHDPSTEKDLQSEGQTPQKKHADQQTADAAIRRMAKATKVEEATDDEMLVAEVGREDLDAMRKKLTMRLNDAKDKATDAVNRFQSILRKRESAPALAKGFGDAASNQVVSWFKGNVINGTLGGQDLTVPVGFKNVPVVGTAYEVTRDTIEGGTKAKQAAAMLSSVDGIIDATTKQIQSMTTDALARLQSGTDVQLLEWDRQTDYTRPPILAADADQLIADLDSMLTESLYKSGSLTTNEYLDRIEGRRSLQGEIDREDRQ